MSDKREPGWVRVRPRLRARYDRAQWARGLTVTDTERDIYLSFWRLRPQWPDETIADGDEMDVVELATIAVPLDSWEELLAVLNEHAEKMRRLRSATPEEGAA